LCLGLRSFWLRCFVFVRSFVRDGTFAELFALVLAAREQARAAVLRACCAEWKVDVRVEALRCEATSADVPSAICARVCVHVHVHVRVRVRGSGIAVAPSCGGAASLCVSAFDVCERTHRDSLGLCSARASVLRPSVHAVVRPGLHRFGVPVFWGIARTFPGSRAIPPRFALVRPSRLLVLPWPDSEKAGFGSVGF